MGEKLDGLGAELAACGCERNVAKALRAGPGGGRRFSGRRVELFEQVMHGQYQKEIDDRGDEDEVDDRGYEDAVLNFSAMNM
jgi:hypothetical protein